MKRLTLPTSFALILALLLLGTFNACTDPTQHALDLDTPRPQADIPPGGDGGGDGDDGGCYVTVPNWNFSTSWVILQPTLPGYDFAIGVIATSSCDMSVVQGEDCEVGQRFYLGFNNMSNTPLSYSDFSEIRVFSSNGVGMPFIFTESNQGLWFAGGGAQVNFKWDSNSPHAGELSEDSFKSGGNCIIGIVMDPNGPPPPDPGESYNQSNG